MTVTCTELAMYLMENDPDAEGWGRAYAFLLLTVSLPVCPTIHLSLRPTNILDIQTSAIKKQMDREMFSSLLLNGEFPADSYTDLRLWMDSIQSGLGFKVQHLIAYQC